MKVLQINSVVNSGSTGRIAEEIGNVLLEYGHESYIAYGRGSASSTSNLIKIGSKKDIYLHGAFTLLTDRHGFASEKATREFIHGLEKLKPDIIVLHNLHGYYINLSILFNWIKEKNIPVVWTLFDCWAFTGHCSYFDDIECIKWKSHCTKCPKHSNYPSSWVDNSYGNFDDKMHLFTSVEKLELVTHSRWLADLVKDSFLRNYPVNVTPSGINLELFKPKESNLRLKYGFGNRKIILGCASTWSNRKGYDDFVSLSAMLDSNYQIVMIGLNSKELRSLPKRIFGLMRTESVKELAQWYSLASVFVNPTSQDNFPTTNLEALACGTPVITYDTGGSPESIDTTTGIVVKKGDLNGIVNGIEKLVNSNSELLANACRGRASMIYDRRKRYVDYLKIFDRLVKQ